MGNKNILIVYYSRSGNTRKIAKELAEKLECDIEEIIDETKRSGIIGYMSSGYQSVFKILPKIEVIQKKPSKYDLVIIGTPTWAKNISSPVRSYLKLYGNESTNGNKIKNIAILQTMGGSKAKGVNKTIIKLTGIQPVAIFEGKMNEIKDNSHSKSLDKFIGKIKQAIL